MRLRVNGTERDVSAAPDTPLANAIHDATGVRVREVPFTPDRIRAAIRTT